MNLKDCHNYNDFRKLAKKKLPSPIFHYIDGGSDDEVTLNRNTEAFNDCDLIPNVLADVGNIDLSTTVLGKKIDFPLFTFGNFYEPPLSLSRRESYSKSCRKNGHYVWYIYNVNCKY